MYIDKLLDDEIYRQWIVSKLNFKDDTIKYFDEKFYTDKYQYNYLNVSSLETLFFAQCISVDLNNKQYVKKLIIQFFNILGKLTDNDKILNLKISSHKSGTYYIQYNNVYDVVKISSYKEMYMIVCALQKVYRINRSNIDNFVITTTHSSNDNRYLWGTKDCNSRQWFVLAKCLIADLLLPHQDYLKIKQPDSTVRYEMVFDKSFPDNIPNRIEEIYNY